MVVDGIPYKPLTKGYGSLKTPTALTALSYTQETVMYTKHETKIGDTFWVHY